MHVDNLEWIYIHIYIYVLYVYQVDHPSNFTILPFATSNLSLFAGIAGTFPTILNNIFYQGTMQISCDVYRFVLNKNPVESQQNSRGPLNLLLACPQLHGSLGRLSGSCPGDEHPGDSPRTNIEWKNFWLENIPFLKGFHAGYMHIMHVHNYNYIDV